MANKKISELISTTDIKNQDIIPIVQDGATKKIPYSNLKEIAVSPTQPTSNESVWIKKGKNRFDKRNLEIVEHWNVNYTVDENKKITVTVPQVTQAVAYIKTSNFVIPKGQHTISLKIEGQLNTIKLINAYNTDICIKDTNENIFTVDLAEDTTVFLYIYIDPSSTTNTLTIENIQIEKGNTATDYEDYIEKEIYVKNSNGVFERFYKEVDDTGWVNLKILNGSAYSNDQIPQIRRIGKQVSIRGALKGITAVDTPLVEIPDDCLPSQILSFTCPGTGTRHNRFQLYHDRKYIIFNNTSIDAALTADNWYPIGTTYFVD